MVKYIILIIPLFFNDIFAKECIKDTIPHHFLQRELDKKNPDSYCPPRTDGGSQRSFKYPFALENRGVFDAGWTRQVTVRDFPIAKQVAGVLMYLNSGGIREMHWHQSAEWAYVIYGNIRVTAVAEKGRAFIADVKEGDLWFFPSGVGHSIQGIGDEGGLFLLAFNDGNFNEFGTFLLTNFMSHMPRDVLAKNFQVEPEIFDKVPNELYIFQGELPGSFEEQRKYVIEDTGFVPNTYAFYASEMKPNVSHVGGSVKVVDRKNFPVTDISGAIITLKPGGMRELHWHPNADEWLYVVKGKVRVTSFLGNSEARTMDFDAGDVGYVPQAQPHYIENRHDEESITLELFASPYFEDVTLALWLAHTPASLVNQHIRTGEEFIKSINKTEQVIEP